MVNTKIESQAQALIDNLNIRLATATKPMPVTKAYDASNDLYLEVLTGAKKCAVVKFETVAGPASGQTDGLGLTQRIFTPHQVKVGFDTGTAASDTVTLTGAVALKKVTINGIAFVAQAAGPLGAGEWLQSGNDAADAAALAAAINGLVDPAITGVVTASAALNVVTIKAVVPGPAGNAIAVASDDASMVVATAKLTGGVNGVVDLLTQVHILTEVARIGMGILVYQKGDIGVADLVQANLVGVYNDLTWGQSASV